MSIWIKILIFLPFSYMSLGTVFSNKETQTVVWLRWGGFGGSWESGLDVPSVFVSSRHFYHVEITLGSSDVFQLHFAAKLIISINLTV